MNDTLVGVVSVERMVCVVVLVSQQGREGGRDQCTEQQSVTGSLLPTTPTLLSPSTTPIISGPSPEDRECEV